MALLNRPHIGRSRCRDRSREKISRFLPPALRITLAVLCLITHCWFTTASRAQAQEPSGEYILKSLVLYNFAKFVEWPLPSLPDVQTSLAICILGQTAFDAATQTIGNKSVQTHPVVVRKVAVSDSLAECHILFVESSDMKTLRTIQHSLGSGPTLTVCDLNDCAEQGFMIGLRMESGKVRLAANLNAIQQTQLKVSSQLIKLATPAGNSR